MFEFATEFSFAPDENKFYLGIANDGHQTYLSSGDRQISILNDSCSLINRVHTYCNYHTICYDCVLKQFWAASSERPGILLCLADNLEELEAIKLSSANPDPIDIDHLFYDKNGKQLYLTTKSLVYKVDKKGHVQKLIEINMDMEKLEGICAYNSYFLCLSRRKEERYLSIHDILNGTLLEEHHLPADFKVSSMTLIQDPLNPLSLCLRLLAVKQGDTPFLIDYKPSLEFFTQYSVASLTDTNQAATPSDVQMQQLCGNPPPYPFSHTGCRGNNQNGIKNSRRPIPPTNCCPDCPGNYQPGCNCCQSFADVIESIALTEASIAHILNAEGEKLQKSIACSKNVSELLKVNESVLKTITHSTHLEQMLYYKLESVLNTGCNCPCCHLPLPPCCQGPLPREEFPEPCCK